MRQCMCIYVIIVQYGEKGLYSYLYEKEIKIETQRQRDKVTACNYCVFIMG